MPAEVLSAEAGFFGKLPCTGDFVARGLPAAFRGHWDAWVTRHLAGRLKDGSIWPEGGLRFRLVSGGRVAAGVIVPGQDSAGREFPLSLLLIGAALPAPDQLDAWCDAALIAAETAQDGSTDADALLDALDAVPLPFGANDDSSGMQLWSAQLGPVPCDPLDPDPAIRKVLPISCC